MTELNT